MLQLLRELTALYRSGCPPSTWRGHLSPKVTVPWVGANQKPYRQINQFPSRGTNLCSEVSNATDSAYGREPRTRGRVVALNRAPTRLGQQICMKSAPFQAFDQGLAKTSPGRMVFTKTVTRVSPKAWPSKIPLRVSSLEGVLRVRGVVCFRGA